MVPEEEIWRDLNLIFGGKAMRRNAQRVLILGASGMLGNAVLRVFAETEAWQTYGTARSMETLSALSVNSSASIITGVDVEDFDNLSSLFGYVRPNIVINCIGVVKQLAASGDALAAIPLNALLPHRLAKLCELSKARLVHVSTDCVFSGHKGMYLESDVPDADDLYGRSKLLGEVDYPHAITLRTSIIGHELSGSRSLINWFLSQKDGVRGFTRAIFSGLPTVELAKVILDYVLPHKELHGLYHVSADPISKFELLKLVSEIYRKDIEIVPDEALIIDRSLDSTRFRVATGFRPKSWPDLIRSMYDFS